MLVVREQAFRLRAKAPRGLRGLRGKRGGKVSTNIDSLTHLKVSNHALSPLVPLVPLVPLSDSWRSERAQLYLLPVSNQPISCQKGHNLAPIKRKSGWDILEVFPIRSLD